jgi:hypothetical protein
MGDTLNSLLAANRSSTVLQGIANPAQVNPLAAMTSAAQTAGTIFDMRQKQATQAAGEAYQGAIDPQTGEFNPNKFRQNLQAAGPIAAMATGTSLANTQSISSDQLNQNLKKAGWVNSAAGAVLQSGDFSDAAMLRLFQTGMANGALTLPEVQRQMQVIPPDAAGRRQWLQEHQMTAASVEQQLNQTRGMTLDDANTIVQVPYPKLNPDGTANPNYGKTFPMRKGDVVPMLATPGQVQGGGGDSGLPPSLRNPANAPPTGTAPAAPPAATTGPTTAPPATGGNTGIGAVLGGSQAPPAAPLPLPPTPPTVVPPPAPLPTAPGAVWNPNNPVGTSTVAPPAANPAAAAVAAAKASGKPVPVPGGSGLVANPDGTVGPPRLPPGPRADLQGGVPVASATNALQPNVGAPGPPSPLVAGDVNAIMAGMQRGTTPPAGAVVAGSPTYFGTGPSAADIEAQKRQVEQGSTGFQAISDQAVASRPRSAILGNMLGDTSQFTTGPLASRIETVRAVANRFGLPVSTEGLSAAESFNKLAAQLANAQGANSDARLNVNVAANPHQELSPAGVDLMLRQLQGNEDYLQARAKLAASYGDQTDIKKFESEVGAKVDPRAFQFARMTPAQRQTYDKGLSATDRAAVRSSYNWLSSQPGLMGQ